MKKNGLCLLLALALMLGLFAGCSNNQQGDEPSAPPAKTDEPATPPADNEPADPAAGEVTLTFWTPTWRQAAEEPIIADFMEKYPNIKIETTFMSSDDIKANTKIAASSNTLPDMWYNWGGVLADFLPKTTCALISRTTPLAMIGTTASWLAHWSRWLMRTRWWACLKTWSVLSCSTAPTSSSSIT